MGPRKGKGLQRLPWHPPFLSTLVSLRPRHLADSLTHSLAGSNPTSHSSKNSVWCRNATFTFGNRYHKIRGLLKNPQVEFWFVEKDNLSLFSANINYQRALLGRKLTLTPHPESVVLCILHGRKVLGRKAWVSAPTEKASWLGDLRIAIDLLLATISQLHSGNKTIHSPPYPTGLVWRYTVLEFESKVLWVGPQCICWAGAIFNSKNIDWCPLNVLLYAQYCGKFTLPRQINQVYQLPSFHLNNCLDSHPTSIFPSFSQGLTCILDTILPLPQGPILPFFLSVSPFTALTSYPSIFSCFPHFGEMFIFIFSLSDLSPALSIKPCFHLSTRFRTGNSKLFL